MKQTTLLVLIVLAAHGAAFAMAGGPLFTLGPGITSMTVEASQVKMNVPMASISDEREEMASRRLFLNGRYGFQENIDVEAKLGVADLMYETPALGYSEYASSPSFAWGAGVRAGFPSGEKYQVTGSLSYVGYRASGSSARGDKTITSTYLWQEIAPCVTLGYQFKQVVPYVGVTKPYLFGSRDYEVAFSGEMVSSASGSESYSDGEQSIRGLFGLEWKLPDGYSLTGECSAASDGALSVSVGIAQALK